jgi:hypothetical protein
MKTRIVVLLLQLAVSCYCVSVLQHPLFAQSERPVDPAVAHALQGIRPDAIRAHLEFLADDRLEGRHTGSRGHEIAARYVRAQFAALGLKGGAKDGGFLEPVNLSRTQVDTQGSSLVIQGEGTNQRLVYNKDYILLDTHQSALASVSAPVVFAGFGVTAPEFNYDDYAGIGVKGKIVVIRAFAAPDAFPATERAYYMDGDVKRQIARQHGAVGLIYVATPELQEMFPWNDVLREVQIGFNSMRWLDGANHVYGLDGQIKATASLNRSGAEALFEGQTQTLDQIFASAKAGKPSSFALKKTVSITAKAWHTLIHSMNVVGVLPGSDPALQNEYVVFTAHLDHLGIGPAVNGDNIYNGALDNAGGSAVLLEIARFFASLPSAPRRSIAFVSLTGEEEGLLGSLAFANASPLHGPIVANINVDGGTFVVPIKDVVAFGQEHSSLGLLAERAAAQTGHELSSDPMPEQGTFVRSDQYSFIRAGVPSLQLDLGYKSDKPGVDPLAELKKWMVTIYHSPKDDASQSIDYPSSAAFARYAALITKNKGPARNATIKKTDEHCSWYTPRPLRNPPAHRCWQDGTGYKALIHG